MNIKSGWKTTEFWGKMITQLLGILVLTGTIDSGQSEKINQISGILTIAIPELGYSISRGIAKLKN